MYTIAISIISEQAGGSALLAPMTKVYAPTDVPHVVLGVIEESSDADANVHSETTQYLCIQTRPWDEVRVEQSQEGGSYPAIAWPMFLHP